VGVAVYWDLIGGGTLRAMVVNKTQPMPSDGCVIAGEFTSYVFGDKFALRLRHLRGKFADLEFSLNLIIWKKKRLDAGRS
jgi:hypothetical protein